MARRAGGFRFCFLLALLLPFAAAADEPEAVYEKVHRATLARDLDTMFRHTTAERRAEIAAGSKTELALIRETLPKSYKVTSRKISQDGNRAQLRAMGMHRFLVGKEAPMYGIVDLVKVGGEWKVDKFGWAHGEWPEEEFPPK